MYKLCGKGTEITACRIRSEASPGKDLNPAVAYIITTVQMSSKYYEINNMIDNRKQS